MSLANQNQPRFKRHLLPLALLAMLIASGAGAATGLVLEDSLTGTPSNSSLSVGQALKISQVTPSGGDGGFATLKDDGSGFSSNFACNNGDVLGLDVTVANTGGNDRLAFLLTVENVPAYLTLAVVGDDGAYNDTDGDGTLEVAVMSGPDTWISAVGAGSNNTLHITMALADNAPTGYLDMGFTLEPVNY